MARIALTRDDFTEENVNGDPQYTHVLNDGSTLTIVIEQDEPRWVSVQRECSEEDCNKGLYDSSLGVMATHDCLNILQLNTLLNTFYAELW